VKELTAYTLQISDIKIQSFKIEDETEDFKQEKGYTFHISVAHTISVNDRQVVVFVMVGIAKPENQNLNLASMQIGIAFNVNELDEVTEEGSNELPNNLRILLHSVSISTARGIIFSHLGGTYLGKVILPIVNPGNFKPQEVEINTTF
jgi:hypothetical protein